MNYLISGLIITLIVPIWGLLIYLLNRIIYNIISKITSEKTAMIIVNWLTVPGVIHHELSHAALAVITGAHITQFRPFWPDKRTGSLGHVNFLAQGTLLERSLQFTFISTAPVLLGTASTLMLLYVIQNASLPPCMLILIIYMTFSIVIHASMSFADVKIMLRGIWVLYLAISFLCFYAGIDLVHMIAHIYK
ncbi:hypothetical protein [Butyrivibrio sp. AC2005]|uniref:hypothetical protein n=1 Tax=Butyrivibrio sp. AC2005 TaxID=1280672 RepID=UPI00041A6743|nr:hypothetical protein [Butyrivibrio sp. AC2005]